MKAINSVIADLKLDTILLKFHEYISPFNNQEKQVINEDIGIKSIKNLLNEIVKQLGN